MKNKLYDVIVIGVGSMGAATLYHLAEKGLKVLGIDRFSVPHEMGSHTGQTRIIRKAYFEHPDYIPLLEKAYASWHELEKTTGEKLFHRVGLVYSGKPDSELLSGVRKSAEQYDVPIAPLSSKELASKFPQMSIPIDYEVIFEEDAGFVLPEKTISLYIKMAKEKGADILEESPVISWEQNGNQYSITTASGSFTSGKIVITAGAWASHLLQDTIIDLKVTLQPLGWMRQPTIAFRPDRFPCFLYEVGQNAFYYGFPDLTDMGISGPQGFKVALHTPGESADPDALRPDISTFERERLVSLTNRFFPKASSSFAAAKSCLYTYSTDTDFIIDYLPDHNQQVVIATGFSGHGFKFSPGIGAAISDMITNGMKDECLDFLTLDRFTPK